jgi:DNA-binding Lrp family transcriptional regulator
MQGIDTVDLRLVRHLLESPRASYAELARHTGVSETTARRRVEALIEARIISPAMIPDVRRLGFTTMAIVGIKVEPRAIEEAAAAISSLPQVTSIHMTLGRYDLMATLADRGLEALSRTILERIAQLPGVRDVETFISTRALKILHNWRPPEAEVNGDAPSSNESGDLDGRPGSAPESSPGLPQDALQER